MINHVKLVYSLFGRVAKIEVLQYFFKTYTCIPILAFSKREVKSIAVLRRKVQG